MSFNYYVRKLNVCRPSNRLSQLGANCLWFTHAHRPGPNGGERCILVTRYLKWLKGPGGSYCTCQQWWRTVSSGWTASTAMFTPAGCSCMNHSRSFAKIWTSNWQEEGQRPQHEGWEQQHDGRGPQHKGWERWTRTITYWISTTTWRTNAK